MSSWDACCSCGGGDVCETEIGGKGTNKGATLSVSVCSTGWRRTIGCLLFIDYILQKSPVISCSFAKRDLQLEASYASSLPCSVSCRIQICDLHVYPHFVPYCVCVCACLRVYI